ncbi:septum formation family protein [Paractinoplanes lichenicola]|uniref:Septum formation family protein n=1 Tax=Paractinoplanes lichenicola TaxID=2802976 RepID=A0ABS1W3H4_9ACTN|nr:septum formation family protein [Actinoplanes lichenicola]MBL7261289.1 septum formation family protein [Actinoplanes lichenicola]
MRRWAAAALVLALGGCADLPEGVDGDLTGGWPAPPAAQQFRPTPGCHPDVVEEGTIDNWSPVACAGPHLTETAVIAEVANGSPGSTASTHRGQAFRECSKRVNTFLGGDWRTGWLVLQPVLPSQAAWQGGARWYRCDLVETSPVDGELVRRSGSLKGSLGGAGKMRMTCANPKVVDERVTAMHPVACSGAHTSEFAGLFVSSRATVAGLTPGELERGCDAAIAKFAGIPNDGTVRNRVGWLGFPPDATSWKLGDRAVRCFLWLNGERMTGSYRNAGTRKLKIHYIYR